MDTRPAKSQHAEREEKILKFWQANKIFEKTLAKDAPKGEFVFFEGPPTANGKPAIHHVEARSFKDVIPRYKTMQGYHVRRKAGWDTHGLPVELQVEKELGFKSKKEIEEYGIAEFNKKCKTSVFTYIDHWRKLSERMGYWTDYDNAYFTFDNNYIESLWNIVGKIDEQNLLYKDYRVAPWCTRCGTTLSSHELAQGYQDVKDISLYVKFKIRSAGKEFLEVLGSPSPGRPDHQKSFSGSTYFLAWTTTPWTLPGNVALAVGEDIDYVFAKVGEEILILAESRIAVLPEGYEIVKKVKGKELAGLAYEPLYTFIAPTEKSHMVYAADFVTTTDGTGIVHTAVMYGADDFALGTKVGLPKYHLVKEDGTFKGECGFLSGKSVIEESTAVEILKDLKERNLLLDKESYTHSYPFCWRCKTRLIYYARDSWYIGMSKLRDVLVKENQKINWEPAYTKEGRFGEWLREVKDWAISRERYWGTPLPVWMSKDGREKLIVDSIDTLKKHTKKSGNRYFVMRHGEAENNTKGILNADNDLKLYLTKKGKDDVRKQAEELKSKAKIDLIIASPIIRTKDTAEIVKEVLGLPDPALIIDERITEMNQGIYNNKSRDEFFQKYADASLRYEGWPEGAESLQAVKRRMGAFIYDIESNYQNKNILIVSHGDPIWMLNAAAQGLSKSDSIAIGEKSYPHKGAFTELDFVPLPHNENFELDLHKPYIDRVELVSKEGKNLTRVKEVMDVWFDSGAMPFAQDHYPFSTEKIAYPADFISEAIDQTRGWFYTLHAVGALMGRGRAYKNVICLGHLLDKDGKKMSKSLGNVLDPWVEMDKWGVDALRLWMYSVNQPGESKNYDEKTVDEVNKKFFNLLTNVLSFYELYRDKTLELNIAPESFHALDQWILVKLDALKIDVTKNLEGYKLLEPVRATRQFIDDLSTWYLQNSRDRFREGDAGAKRTLYYVLKEMSKILAPFAPFFAEDLYQKLRVESDPESVHLEMWPCSDKVSQGGPFKFLALLGRIFARPSKNLELLDSMEKTRQIVSIGLEARSKSNIKVRQPLASLTVSSDLKVPDENLELVKDRVNVKEILFGKEMQLDTNLTEELKEEGIVREIIRFVQDMRKRQGLTPSDRITLSISPNQILQKEKWQKMLMDAVQADKINLLENQGEKLEMEDLEFTISIQK